jgi:hypothetical protein
MGRTVSTAFLFREFLGRKVRREGLERLGLKVLMDLASTERMDKTGYQFPGRLDRPDSLAGLDLSDTAGMDRMEMMVLQFRGHKVSKDSPASPGQREQLVLDLTEKMDRMVSRCRGLRASKVSPARKARLVPPYGWSPTMEKKE